MELIVSKDQVDILSKNIKAHWEQDITTRYAHYEIDYSRKEADEQCFL